MRVTNGFPEPPPSVLYLWPHLPRISENTERGGRGERSPGRNQEPQRGPGWAGRKGVSWQSRDVGVGVWEVLHPRRQVCYFTFNTQHPNATVWPLCPTPKEQAALVTM